MDGVKGMRLVSHQGRKALGESRRLVTWVIRTALFDVSWKKCPLGLKGEQVGQAEEKSGGFLERALFRDDVIRGGGEGGLFVCTPERICSSCCSRLLLWVVSRGELEGTRTPNWAAR